MCGTLVTVEVANEVLDGRINTAESIRFPPMTTICALICYKTGVARLLWVCKAQTCRSVRRGTR